MICTTHNISILATTLATTLVGINVTTMMVKTSTFVTLSNFTSEFVRMGSSTSKMMMTSSVPTTSVDIMMTPFTTSPTFTEVVNVIQGPMLKLEESLNNSSEKLENQLLKRYRFIYVGRGQ